MRIQERKQKRKKRTTYFLLSVFLVLALFTPFYSYLYDVLEKPFISMYAHTNELKKDSKNFFSTWISKKKLIEENNKLKHKIAILEVDILRTKYLESLLEQNHILNSIHTQSILTSVIGKNNSGIITILGGEDANFSIGDKVVSYDGVFVGEISEVFDISSRVRLLVKDGFENSGVLFPEDISIEVVGNGNALFSKINRDIEVAVGDTVYAQETSGYIIGTVSAIDFDPRDPSKKIYISPIYPLTSLQEVGVLKKNTGV